ncbi:histidine phosphatase superfamily [Syncephalis fuscata]|nr:histidine phosphatase superfamily [Syncephalis fuscata]
MWRTKQSAASFLTGVWPKKNARAADAQILPIIVYPYEVETMRSRKDNTCPRFDEIKDNMRKSDQYHAVFARHNSLRDRLEKILGTGGIEKYKKSWTKYMDPLRARVCHNMTLPCLNNECLTVRDVDELNQGVNEEVAMMYGALPEAKEHNLLSLGYFMGELRDRLMNAVNGASTVSSDDNGHAAILTPKFELFSGHDTTPDMKHNDPNNYVIRIIYNGRSLAADWCDFKACPLPKYLEHIEEYIERDLSNACKTH